MKATEQYFRLVLCIMPYKVFLTFAPIDKILWCDNQRKPTKQYFPVVLFIMVDMVVLTLKTAGEILRCNHSNIISRGRILEGG